jgi:hypothetical protein
VNSEIPQVKPGLRERRNKPVFKAVLIYEDFAAGVLWFAPGFPFSGNYNNMFLVEASSTLRSSNGFLIHV